MGGVFISYRREDSAGFTGRIYDRLTKRLGRERVFLDVDNIPPGMDFVDVLSERVGGCDALIAVIGRNWLTSVDEDNRRRIENQHDFVRVEIEAELTRGVRVIPILVDGARMPRAEDLPDSLKQFSRRQGIDISHAQFDSDIRKLTRTLSLLDEGLRQRAETERAAREERERAAKFEEARQAGPYPLVRMHGDRKWRAPLLLVGAAALVVAWFLFAPFGPPHGNTPAVESSASRSQPHESSATPSGQAALPNSPPAPAPKEQSLTPAEENERGDSYFFGRGVDQDYAKAMEWYRKAADQGYADAQSNVGVLYENGMGVAKDIEQARAWYQKAADQGNAGAKGALERLVGGNSTSAATTPEGQYDIGDNYYYGRGGVNQDYQEAMVWYRKAANQGYAGAQYRLGWLYENGSGVKTNFNQAKAWYQKAADQGNAGAKGALERLGGQ